MNKEMAITELDKEVLTKFVEEHQIRRVLEFGMGKSTVLFDTLGVRTSSFETMYDIRNQYAKLTSNNVSSHIWNGTATDKLVYDYCDDMVVDLVFIDGPEGGINREPSYILAKLTRARFIACHDAVREHESRWINKYLKDWTLVKSVYGLSIYENKPVEAKVLIATPMHRNYKMDTETDKFCTSSLKKGWLWLKCPSVEPTLARNMLITWFLLKKELADFTHIFFVDADTIPPFYYINKLSVASGTPPSFSSFTMKNCRYHNIHSLYK